jgi:hypothetical protein
VKNYCPKKLYLVWSNCHLNSLLFDLIVSIFFLVCTERVLLCSTAVLKAQPARPIAGSGLLIARGLYILEKTE